MARKTRNSSKETNIKIETKSKKKKITKIVTPQKKNIKLKNKKALNLTKRLKKKNCETKN